MGRGGGFWPNHSENYEVILYLKCKKPVIAPAGAYTGGGAVALLSHPGIYGQRLKSGRGGKNKLALVLKWVFSPFKVVENFLGAERYLFPTFILVFPLYLKSPPPPYLNKQ